MLHTYLTTSWHLRYPIIGAPMAYVGRGRLARAVSQAGGLGMIGIGSNRVGRIHRARGCHCPWNGSGRFGIGLMAWALERRPELLDAAIEANPFLISISFGSACSLCGEAAPARHLACHAGPHTSRSHPGRASRSRSHCGAGNRSRRTCHRTGEYASTSAIRAGRGSGTRACRWWHRLTTRGGRSPCRRCRRRLGRNLPACLSRMRKHRACPVTHCPGAGNGDRSHPCIRCCARIAWPPQYPGRALRNRFTDQWHHQIDALPQDEEARQQLAEAIASKNYDLAHIYAGEAVGLVTRQQPAAEVIRQLGDGAERLLRDRSIRLLEGSRKSREE